MSTCPEMQDLFFQTMVTYNCKPMKTIKLILATVLGAVMCAPMGVKAQTAVVDAFKSAPAAVFPLIDSSTRLDMIDYYNSTSNVGATNALSGRSRITELTPESMRIAMTSSSHYQVVALPMGNETLTAVLTTVLTPAPDSKMTVYSSDWSNAVTDKVFSRPVLKDWLTADGRKNIDEVEMLVPFLLVGYDFDPATKTLTLTNNVASFLSEEVYEIVKPYFHNQLQYSWNGKKFVAVK